MRHKFKAFFQCINEKELIEAKLDWCLRHEMEVSVVEGCHPHYPRSNEKGLSVDGTSEILKSYSDRITYTPLGRVPHQAVLRDVAYKKLSKEPGICIMSDVDEFYLDKDLRFIDVAFINKNLKLVLTNSYIFLDNEYCAPHIQRKEGNPFEFSKVRKDGEEGILLMWHGMFHERIFRYNKFYGYRLTPFLVNDLLGRHLFNHPAYFGERVLFNDIYMLHYKNFKRKEAEARLEMYKKRGDKVDYSSEWDELEKNKTKYEGEHPREILELIRVDK